MDIIKSKAQIVVIGGKDENENLLNDIWVMDIINMHWINAKIIKNIGI